MTRHLTVIFLALALVGCAETPGEHESTVEASPRSTAYVDLTADFAEFHDAVAELSDDARIEAFRARIVPLFPEFYGDPERFDPDADWKTHGARVIRALDEFPGIRETYETKANTFSSRLDKDLDAFQNVFPEFDLEVPVYLLHSLGEMDGGVRDLDGTRYLIFGADGMARYHQGWQSETAFFHHELFHVYHGELTDPEGQYSNQESLGPCRSWPVWCLLWGEGLAVHVAHVLNPDASDAELLLDIPAGMATATRDALPEALAHLKAVLDSEDNDVKAPLFWSGEDDTGLPARYGYYLGYRIARHLAREHSLDALARLPFPEARVLIETAIDEMLLDAVNAAEAEPS